MIHSASSPNRNQSLTLYALGAIFLAPLLIGVVLVRNNVDRDEIANQVSHDVASMYSQGMDFSKAENQAIALRVAEGAGLKLEGGRGVVILSKLHIVKESDCPSGTCGNLGHPVVVERFVIGSADLRASSLGVPASLDPMTGRVENWATDPSAQVADASLAVNPGAVKPGAVKPGDGKPGEFTYAAECYLAGHDPAAGVYTRALF